MQKILSIVLVTALTWFSVSGCATSQERAFARTQAADYYPLDVGNRWVFRASSPGQAGESFEVRIDSRDSDGFYISSQGMRMMRRAGGIFDGERFLIEDPIEVGHEWMAVPSASVVERFRIVATKVPVSVPAGSFSDCVQVEMSQAIRGQDGSTGRLVGVWTYAKNVGPVYFKQWVEFPEMEDVPNVEFQLLEFEVTRASDGGRKADDGQVSPAK